MRKKLTILTAAVLLAASLTLPAAAGTATGPALEIEGGSASGQSSQEGSGGGSISAGGASKDGTAVNQGKGYRKTDEEIRQAMASVPAGPAKAEWGTFFVTPNQAPINDEKEDYLRSFGAYAMVPTEEKYVYLTFDEGYEAGYTPAILDTLKKHNVKAAFFITGSYLRDCPDLVKRIAEEGHIIGNHTLSHPSMMKVGTWDEFGRQLLTVEQNYQASTGYTMPRYYRPPSGGYSEAHLRMAQAMGFKTIFWSVAYKDWDTSAQPSREFAMNYLTSRIHPGAIILLHAVSATNTEIMDELLTRWEQMGYSFRTLDELPEGLTE